MENFKKNRILSYILILIVVMLAAIIPSCIKHVSNKRVEYVMEKSQVPVGKYLLSITDLSTGNKEMTTIKSYVAETCCIRVTTTDNVEVTIPREGKKIVIEEVKINK